jgi:hypothetical protein
MSLPDTQGEVLNGEKQLLKEHLQRIASQNTYDPSARVQVLEKHLNRFFVPENFNYHSPESFEHTHEQQFTDLCFFLQEYYSMPVRQLNVYEFFRLIEYVKKKLTPPKK